MLCASLCVDTYCVLSEREGEINLFMENTNSQVCRVPGNTLPGNSLHAATRADFLKQKIRSHPSSDYHFPVTSHLTKSEA